jgi:hypothetical protein
VASDSIRIGPCTASLGVVDRTIALPSLAAVTVDAAAATPTTNELNDVLVPLSAQDDYYSVYVAAFGFDVATSGYTFGTSSVITPVAPLDLTAGQGVAIHIDNADFPALLVNACGIAVFLKQGSADPVLCQIDVLDPTKDFDTIVVAEPHPACLSFLASVLTAGTVTEDTGSRAAKGMNLRLLGPTIGGVGLDYNVEGPNVNLDSGTAFPIPTARQPTVSFAVADNSALNFVRANGGIYTRFTANGHTIDISRQSLASAVARIIGNTVLRLILPPDNEGLSEQKFIFSMLKGGNVSANSVRFGKTDVPTVNFNMPSAIQDRLLRNIHCEVTRRYKA